jgi:hypothetical protein
VSPALLKYRVTVSRVSGTPWLFWKTFCRDSCNDFRCLRFEAVFVSPVIGGGL